MNSRVIASDVITGSPSKKRVASAATTNATLVKGYPGCVYGWLLSNNTASIKVVKFYDVATLPVPGTTPVDFTVILPANAVSFIQLPSGIPFAAGIGFAIVTTVPDATNTATAVDDVHGVILYK